MHDQTHPVVLNRRYPPAPLVGVAAVVFNAAGEVLLVQRAAPPRQGQWGLPGGLLDLGERLRDGVRREVQEECGIQIEVGDVVGAFEPIQRDAEGRVEYHYVVIDFWARHISGEAVAADDAAAVAWANPDALAEFALSPDTHAVVLEAHAAWCAAET
jgi:ADP-ribose pyrophosphatase YjhB (NUDIX family)